MNAALVALGDSFVEGRGDDAPGGGYRGWVPRLGGQLGLRPASVRNLGAHGATTAAVVEHQLPRAFAARAGLYGVVCGVNDLVSDFHPARFERNLRTLFSTLRASGATVVTANYPDIPARLPVPPGMRSLLRERFAFANAVLGEVTDHTGALLLDLAGDPAWERPEMWTADGLHPAPLGHHTFAVAAAGAIADRTATTVAA